MKRSEREWAAITDDSGKVHFNASVPLGITRIEVAGAVAAGGAPVNRRNYKVSRSKRSLASANHAPMLVERTYSGLTFYVE